MSKCRSLEHSFTIVDLYISSNIKTFYITINYK